MGKQYNELSDQIDRDMQDCPDCYGTGYIPDSLNPKTFKPTTCPTCNGTGEVPYTDDDKWNDQENENIGNADMMADDV
jgi:DnaJ-class molecular chaperone